MKISKGVFFWVFRNKSSAHRTDFPRKHFPKLRILRGRKVDAHQGAGLAAGVEEGAGGEQIAVVQHGLCQLVGVYASVYPSE